MNILDNLAAWWLVRKRNRQVEKYMKEHGEFVEIINATMKGSRLDVDLTFPGLSDLFQEAVHMMQVEKVENYLQFIMLPALTHKDLRPVEITMRWYDGGMLPAQKNDMLSKRLNAAIKRQENAATSMLDFIDWVEEHTDCHNSKCEIAANRSMYCSCGFDQMAEDIRSLAKRLLSGQGKTS